MCILISLIYKEGLRISKKMGFLLMGHSDPGIYPAECSHYIHKNAYLNTASIDKSVEKQKHSYASGNAN